MVCEPIVELSNEIEDILNQEDSNFPFEYYAVRFFTFSGESYTGYRKFLKHLAIDSSQINNEYATREYIKTIYISKVAGAEKNKHQNEYISENVKIFYEEDNDKSTFEICLYDGNKELCDEIFLPGRRKLTAIEYMLKNKADSAFELLDKKAVELKVPDYIKKAVEWIKE